MKRFLFMALIVCLAFGSRHVAAQVVFEEDDIDQALDIEPDAIDGQAIHQDSIRPPDPETEPDLPPNLESLPPLLRPELHEKRAPREAEILVFRLRYSTGQWARQKLAEIFAQELGAGELRLTDSDDGLIARAPKHLLQQIRTLIEQIDVPRNPENTFQVENKPGNLSEYQLLDELEKDSRYTQLRNEIDMYKDEMARLSGLARPNSRETQQYENEIARVEQKLAAVTAELAPRIASRLLAKKTDETRATDFGSDPLQKQLRDLVAQYHSTDDNLDVERITTALRQAVEQRFVARQARQTQQVQQLRKKLQSLESRIQQRAQHREQIIERTLQDLLSKNDFTRNETIKSIGAQEQRLVAAPPEEPARPENLQGPIGLTHRVNYYYSAADIARLENELARKQKLYDKGYINDGDLRLARARLALSKRAAKRIEKELMTQLKMREFDLEEAKVKLEVSEAEAERMRELQVNKSVTNSQVRSAIAAARLANIDIDRVQVEIESIQSRLKEFHAAHAED